MKRDVWKRKYWKWVRLSIQLIFLIFLPSVYASSYGAVKQVFTSLGKGEVISWSEFSWNFIITGGVTIMFGRIFCGYACAFGMLGDVVYHIFQWTQKKMKKKKRLEWKPDIETSEKLSLMKYIVLLVTVSLCFTGSQQIVNGNSPWTVFSMLLAGNYSLGDYFVGVELLVLILIGMAVKERFFCQYLCPMGAIYSLLPILPTGIYRRDNGKCTEKCNACQKNCPVDLKLEMDSARQGECIRCGRCVQICPKNQIKPAISQRIQ